LRPVDALISAVCDLKLTLQHTHSYKSCVSAVAYKDVHLGRMSKSRKVKVPLKKIKEGFS